jgi:hypothetical protein
MVNTVLSSDASDAERLAILNEFGVSYVVSRLQDRQSATFAQADPPYLIPVFTQGQVTVYRTQTTPQALSIPMSLSGSDPILIWLQPEIET